MSNDEIRTAIAHACGWRWKIYDDGNLDAVWSPGPKGKWEGSFVRFIEGLPNYPEDLNAMHEAEKTLKPPKKFDDFKSEVSRYEEHLCQIVKADASHKWNGDSFKIAHATARQRAEAFLRVKGLRK